MVQVVSPSTLRDLDWASQTCTLGSMVIGIWPENADGTDVNACTNDPTFDLLATGDDHGKVKLFRCPADKPRVRPFASQSFYKRLFDLAFFVRCEIMNVLKDLISFL